MQKYVWIALLAALMTGMLASDATEPPFSEGPYAHRENQLGPHPDHGPYQQCGPPPFQSQ